MSANLARKLIESHLVSGELTTGSPIAIRIDQTLTQDATGTMADLQFEALGIDRVRTELSVSYVDHNMLQAGFENADDHRYLQSIAARYGMYFSKPGNGICHQVHLERFGVPGKTLLGSDSHTPTCGGLGMIAMGAGGLDIAIAMAGQPFHLTMPTIMGIELVGSLAPWVTAKDIILEVLRRLTVKGGVGKILEYHGAGVETLSVPERATITNMGAELGATTSLFPSDERTLQYLKLQKREEEWRPLSADASATYDEHLVIDLTSLEPLIAKPHSPDHVVRVREVAGLKLDQVCVGSCTNSSLHDLWVTAAILKGHHIHSSLSMTISPGSRQVFVATAEHGALADMISAGARVLESACGPCIGMGQAPPSGGISLRSFNRNFKGRSGTQDAGVYLASPEVCTVSALTGEITDPRDWGSPPVINIPVELTIDDELIEKPFIDAGAVEIVRGPNIKPLPRQQPLKNALSGSVLLKVEDNITTDQIMPAGTQVLPLRSNIPAISEYVFYHVDREFASRARELGGGVIVAGTNYGQGSSREHAALAPAYLGIKAVVAKSFARIHRANLINFGILPLVFSDPADYDQLELDDMLEFPEVSKHITEGVNLVAHVPSKDLTIKLRHDFDPFQRSVLLAGGLLNYTRLSAEMAKH